MCLLTFLSGSTPYGWMTLQGNKLDGTDLHTKIAKEMGIKRSESKVLNYSRLYGSGIEFASHLLAKFCNITVSCFDSYPLYSVLFSHKF